MRDRNFLNSRRSIGGLILTLAVACVSQHQPARQNPDQLTAKADDCHEVEAALSQMRASKQTDLLESSGTQARAGTSYLVTGLSYAGQGVVAATTGTLSFVAQCAIPLTAFIYAGSSPSVPWNDLCFGERLYYYNPHWGYTTWKETQSWRQDPNAKALHEAELAVAACYAQKNKAAQLPAK